jgi:hypothetical protein
LQSKAAAATSLAFNAVKRLFKRHADDKDAESSKVALQTMSLTTSNEESEIKPTSILVFADSRPLNPSSSLDNREAASSNLVAPLDLDVRGSAALKFFLVIFISPVEICLKMLTCYALPGL